MKNFIFLFSILFLLPSLVDARITEAALAELIKEHGIPGISVSVVKKGKAKNYQAGYADVEAAVPLEGKHRMLLGSIGKSFFAAQTLLLQEKGKLQIDQKASEYLKADWFRSLPNAVDITIRSLLNHTSGVPEYVYERELWETIKAQLEKNWTAAERMAFIQESEAHFPVGKGWSYADANYIILGAILEKITGEDLYDLVQRNFLMPQNLTQTSPSTQAKLDNITAAYTGGMFADIYGEKVSQIGEYGLNPQFEWTGGGFISHPKDLATWIYRLYRGEILTKASTDMMFQAANRQTGVSDIVGYGFGTEVYATRYGLAYGHTGFMLGFNSAMFYFPEQDLAIAFQVNADQFNKSVKRGTSVHLLMDKIMAMLVKKPKVFKKTTELYFVRHSEKAKDGTNNPDLSEAGKIRADRLKDILSDGDIAAIYSTNYKRTQQTATPLAKATGKEIQVYSPRNLWSVFEALEKYEGQKVLIVGHSNTIPSMVNFLRQNSDLPDIKESEYEDIYHLFYKSKKQVFEGSTYDLMEAKFGKK